MSTQNHQATIERLNALFALPLAQWAVVDEEAMHLIDQLAGMLGEDAAIVDELDRKLKAAQEGSRRWQQGGSGNSAAQAPVPAPPPPAPVSEEPILADLAEPTPLGAALRALAAEGRFLLRGKLQAGYYSAGYTARDCQTSAPVVVKLPTNDGEGWQSRFTECDAALASEAAILPRACAAIAADPTGSAIPVAHVAAGTLHIPSDWPFPVTWLAQRFAQGRRVSDLVPLRDAQEPEGLRILSQVTTMTRRLYAQNLAHRDLKEDALFWDGDRVEVIDWNRATESPDADDRQRELESLQRLVSTMFFGPTQRWGEHGVGLAEAAHTDAWALFVAFGGRPLSRGTRGLLFRSLAAGYLDPEAKSKTPRYPGALTTLEGLDGALAEQCAYWATPLATPPPIAEVTPRTLGTRLDQLSVEVLRPAETSAAPGQALDWLLAGYDEARKEADAHLRRWLSVPETMRTAFPRLEEVWFWLPDVWPLALVVPLSKLVFRHVAPGQDAWLSKLVRQLVTNQYAEAAAIAQQIAPTAPAALQTILGETARMARAYQTLAALEAAPPDPAAGLRTLTQVREVIPFEPRTLAVLRRLSAEDERGARIIQLQAELRELSQRPPDSRTQRELLATMQRLRELGVEDTRYPTLQRIVALLDQAKQALADADASAAAGAWPAARGRLEPWAAHADLREVAPDLAARLAARAAKGEDHARSRQAGEFLAQVQAALGAGELSLVGRLCVAARLTFADRPPMLGFVDELTRALPALGEAISQLQQGQWDSLALLAPASYPPICVPLVAQINGLANVGRVLRQVRPQPIKACGDALQRVLQIEASAPSLVEVRRRMAAEGSELVLGRLRERLSAGTALTPEELPDYEGAIQLVQASESGARLELLATQTWLSFQRDRQQQERLFEVREHVAQTLNAVSNNITGVLNTDLKGLATQADLSANLKGLATQADLSASLAKLTRDIADIPVNISSEFARNLDALMAEQRAIRDDTAMLRQALIRTPQEPKHEDSSDKTSPKSTIQDRFAQWGLAEWTLLSLIIMLIAGTAIWLTLRPPWGTSSAPTSTAQPLASETVVPTSRITGQSAATTEPVDATTEPVDATTEPVADSEMTSPLGQYVKLPSGVTAKETAQLILGQVALPLTVTVGVDSATVFIPETLLISYTEGFGLPLTGTLQLSDTYSMPLRIDQSVLTVGELAKLAEETFVSTGQYAYIWKSESPDKHRTPFENALQVPGSTSGAANYLVLQAGDQVKILGGANDFYHIQVVTNKDNPDAKDQTGWVRKTLVHGQK